MNVMIALRLATDDRFAKAWRITLDVMPKLSDRARLLEVERLLKLNW